MVIVWMEWKHEETDGDVFGDPLTLNTMCDCG